MLHFLCDVSDSRNWLFCCVAEGPGRGSRFKWNLENALQFLKSSFFERHSLENRFWDFHQKAQNPWNPRLDFFRGLKFKSQKDLRAAKSVVDFVFYSESRNLDFKVQNPNFPIESTLKVLNWDQSKVWYFFLFLTMEAINSNFDKCG